MAKNIAPPKQNPEFLQLEENDTQNVNQSITSKPITFDDILTNSIQFGKYQYISALIICNFLK